MISLKIFHNSFIPNHKFIYFLIITAKNLPHQLPPSNTSSSNVDSYAQTRNRCTGDMENIAKNMKPKMYKKIV